MKRINFKDKKLYYGGYSALMFSLLLGIVLLVNALASSMNIKLDLTEEKFYSLSEKTTSITQSVTDPIHIYVLEETGSENPDFKELLQKYERLNDQVSVIYKDPILYPQFANAYMSSSETLGETSLPNGSLIIENQTTGKFKIIYAYELYNIGFDSYSGPTIQSIAIEERVTGAIDYVTSTTEHQVLVTSGHGEYQVPMSLISQLEKENFVVGNINLLSEELPHDATTTLLIYSPHIDFTEAERDKIIDFLESGGKAMLFTDADAPSLPHFEEILSLYGVVRQPGLIVEGDQNAMISPYPTFILPKLSAHQITQAITQSEIPVVTPLAGGLKMSDTMRDSVTVTPILSSTSQAYLKPLDATNIEKESGDLEGPIDIAYAIEDIDTLGADGTTKTQLVVMSNTFLLDSTQVNVSSTANLELVMNSFLWLQNKENSLYIGPKAWTNYAIPITSSGTVLIFAGITIVLLPLTVLIVGIIMWRKRRHL